MSAAGELWLVWRGVCSVFGRGCLCGVCGGGVFRGVCAVFG